MNAFLLSLATLLVVALLALFAAPLYVDWNAYRPEIEAQASALVGRKVVIEGPINVRVLPAPILRFQAVKIADAEGRLERPFAEAVALRAWLSLTPLMSGKVEARRVEIESPTLRLALDEKGSGNWDDIVRGDRRPAYFPNAISLEAVSLSNATVEIERAGSERPLRLEKVNGDLSVRALAGPYNFDGIFVHDGLTRELRFSTAAAGSDGKFRLKSMLRDVANGISYHLDGDVTGFSATPSYLGTFIARSDPEPNPESEEKKPQGPKPEPPMEVKAVAAIDIAKAELANVEVVLRRGSQTFNLKGEATVGLTGTPVLNGALNARLIDLDALVGGGPAATPYATLAALAGELTEAGGGLKVGSFDLAFDQATIGTDLVKDLSLRLAPGEGNQVELRDLRAMLPGETTIEASGNIDATDGGTSFTGKLGLAGRNLRSLTRWASGGGAFVAQSEAGEFSLDTGIKAGPETIALTGARGQARGTSFEGSLQYRGGDHRALDLALTSDRLDITDLVEGPLSLRPLVESLSSDDPDQPASGLGFIMSDTELRLKVGIGSLVAPGLPRGKLDVELSYAGDTIDVKRLNFAAGEILDLSAAGRIERSSATPRGRLDLILKAATVEGARAVATLVALPDSVATGPRLERLLPLGLTIALDARPEAKDTAVLTADGTFGKTAVSVRTSFNGKPGEASQGRWEAEATLSADNPQTALGLLFPAIAVEDLGGAGPGRAVMTAMVSGAPAEGLTAKLAFDAQQTRFSYDGRIWNGEAFALDGALAAFLNDTGLALRLAGLPTAPAAAGSSLDAKAKLTGTATSVSLTDVAGTAAGERIEGTAKIDLAGAKPVIDATLKAKVASFGGVFGSMLTQARGSGDSAQEEDANHRVWPEHAFALEALKSFDLKLKMTADAVRLAQDVTLSNARVDAQLTDGTIRIDPLKGLLFGGAFEVKGSITPRGGGAALEGSIALRDGSLDLLTRRIAGRSAADGIFGFKVTIEGDGLSPSGIASSLVGKGEVDLRQGTLANLSAEPLQQVDDDMGIASRASLGTDRIAELAQQLPTRVTSGKFSFARATLPFDIRNGMVRIENAVLRGEMADASVDLHLELATLRLDSEWTVGLRSASEQVPAITLVVAGPLAEGHMLTAAVETEALQRYLTMRSMEHDVERLEKLDVTGKNPPEPEPEPRQPGQQSKAAPIELPAIKPPKPKAATVTPRRRAPPPASAQQETLPWSPFTTPNGPPSRVQPRRERSAPPRDEFFDQFRGG